MIVCCRNMSYIIKHYSGVNNILPIQQRKRTLSYLVCLNQTRVIRNAEITVLSEIWDMWFDSSA